MRLYVSTRVRGSASTVAEVATRVAISPAGAVRQLLELAGLDKPPVSNLLEDPHGLAGHLDGGGTHYDVSEHEMNTDSTAPGDAVPSSLTDDEYAEMQALMASFTLNARSRSLMKRYLDAPLPHQMCSPEEAQERLKALEAEWDASEAKRDTSAKH